MLSGFPRYLGSYDSVGHSQMWPKCDKMDWGGDLLGF